MSADADSEGLDGLPPDQTVWFVPAHRHTGTQRRYHTERDCIHLTKSSLSGDIHDSPARTIVPHASQCRECADEVDHSNAGPKTPCPFCGAVEILPRHLPCDGEGGGGE